MKKYLLTAVAVLVLLVVGFSAGRLLLADDEKVAATQTDWHSLENWQRCRDTGQPYVSDNGSTYLCEVYDGDKPYWKKE